MNRSAGSGKAALLAKVSCVPVLLFSWTISPFLPPALLRWIGHAIEQRGKELVAQGLVLRIRREFPLVRWLIEQVGGGDRPAGGMQQGV